MLYNKKEWENANQFKICQIYGGGGKLGLTKVVSIEFWLKS